MADPTPPRLKVKAQVIVGDQIAIGPGKVALLEAIATTGSIAAAGRTLGISYRRTRDMIDIANTHWGAPLVATTKGGTAHGGARLTERGQEVLAAWHALDQALHQAAEEHGAALLRLITPTG